MFENSVEKENIRFTKANILFFKNPLFQTRLDALLWSLSIVISIT